MRYFFAISKRFETPVSVMMSIKDHVTYKIYIIHAADAISDNHYPNFLEFEIKRVLCMINI